MSDVQLPNSDKSALDEPDAGRTPVRFRNPGLPAHRHRNADVDPRAARRAEHQVLVLLALSALGTLVFIVAYFAVPLDGTFATLQVSNISLGLGLGCGIFFIGIAAVHLAKTLMPDTEMIDERHPQRGTDAEREDAAAIMVQGGHESGLGRRKFVLGGLVGAAALAPLPAVVLLRDLGPLPGDDLAHTLWDEGVRLALDPSAEPILASDVTIGSVFHVIPENLYESEHFLDEKAKAAVLVMRVDPDVVQDDPSRAGWDVDGIYAYSKICTHVGCPVALYEQQTHHLLCPCHQSTFDLTQHCKVIFGPANRALPQLPIRIDDEGYLVAQSDFLEPPGPSYWERG
ncbi:Rieske 2Fe-2S domain-containing protein [Pseudokineococcus basanitobsidens]|uniref:Cytochrome bc1 complex Rieske iron-sulfur subunit n=1 Tax=Pseudokineococcus basanitobsidens TaxID=1926649 RepID=A0ABU8RJG6_9ACTN